MVWYDGIMAAGYYGMVLSYHAYHGCMHVGGGKSERILGTAASARGLKVSITVLSL